VAIYVVHGQELLIVPTKTASMTVEYCAGDRVRSRDAIDPGLPATLLTRDPVSWYISGYRHCHSESWWQSESSYRECATFDFARHLRLCITRRDRALLGTLKEITPWDFHSWINAEYQASGKFYELDRDQPNTYTGPFRVESRVQIEDTQRFAQTVRRFTNCRDVTQEYHNRNTDAPMRIVIDDTVRDLLRELDDWSHLSGYSFDKSVLRARKRLNTLCV